MQRAVVTTMAPTDTFSSWVARRPGWKALRTTGTRVIARRAHYAAFFGDEAPPAGYGIVVGNCQAESLRLVISSDALPAIGCLPCTSSTRRHRSTARSALEGGVPGRPAHPRRLPWSAPGHRAVARVASRRRAGGDRPRHPVRGTASLPSRPAPSRVPRGRRWSPITTCAPSPRRRGSPFPRCFPRPPSARSPTPPSPNCGAARGMGLDIVASDLFVPVVADLIEPSIIRATPSSCRSASASPRLWETLAGVSIPAAPSSPRCVRRSNPGSSTRGRSMRPLERTGSSPAKRSPRRRARGAPRLLPRTARPCSPPSSKRMTRFCHLGGSGVTASTPGIGCHPRAPRPARAARGRRLRPRDRGRGAAREPWTRVRDPRRDRQLVPEPPCTLTSRTVSGALSRGGDRARPRAGTAPPAHRHPPDVPQSSDGPRNSRVAGRSTAR